MTAREWSDDFLDKIVVGDCCEVLRRIPAGSVQCCVTSPPYWGLRDYGVSGQLGLERTPDEYIKNLTRVFAEVRRVLRDDGTLWLNLGDSYAGSWGAQGRQGDPGITGRSAAAERQIAAAAKRKSGTGSLQNIPGLKSKDMVGAPWRVALALQADGWYLRSDIIWVKPNPMPESVTDRPTKAHEYLFLLAKSQKYFYDADAIKEPIAMCTVNDRVDTGKFRKDRGYPGSASAGSGRLGDASDRNKRSVWEVTTQPYSEAHFATFPPKLIEPCILAGTSDQGSCSECNKPIGRILGDAKGGTIGEAWGDHSVDAERGNAKTGSSKGYIPAPTIGGDRCHGGQTNPCIVLDPFMGAGTTALVAAKHSRSFIGCELNPEYAEIARKRTRNELAQGKML